MLAEFVYGGEVTPTLPLSPFKESAFYWQVKKRALPPFYFDYMLKGREGDIAHKQRGQGKSGPRGHFLGPCKLRTQSTIRASRSDNNHKQMPDRHDKNTGTSASTVACHLRRPTLVGNECVGVSTPGWEI